MKQLQSSKIKRSLSAILVVASLSCFVFLNAQSTHEVENGIVASELTEIAESSTANFYRLRALAYKLFEVVVLPRV